MTVPRLTFEVAFGVDPNTVPTAGQWVDLSSRVRSNPGVSWTFGRRFELDRTEAGVGSVTLDNADRELDPANEASTYWPDVKPMVRCRLIADTYSDVYSDTYDGTQVFEGFIEGWRPVWPGQTDSVVQVPIVDGFKLLSQARTSAAYTEETSGSRIGNLLDAAGWPASTRDLDTGQSDVQAYTESDRTVLSAIKEAATTEDGVFLIAPDGTATFRDRNSRILNLTSEVTFGDGAGELPYYDLVPSFDDERVWNDISVTPAGLTVQRASDSASESSYGLRSLSLSTLHTSELVAADFAGWLVTRYAQPTLRVDTIVLLGHADDEVLGQVLTRTPGDRVTIKRRPPGGGDPIVLEVFIESVTHNVTAAEWVTTWGLSAASSQTFWLLGEAGFSEIGETTTLGF